MQPVRLILGIAEYAVVDMCGACGASFFDYFAGELAQVTRAILRKDAAAPAPAQPLSCGAPDCPDCEDPLDLRHYLEDGPLVYLCDSCLAAFVTAAQLRHLAEFDHHRKASNATLRALVERLGVS